MTNFEKIMKELNKDNLRMLLVSLETPVRCQFCEKKNCGTDYRAECTESIKLFLEKDAE